MTTINSLYPKPAVGVAGQSLSVTGANHSFTGYTASQNVSLVTVDVQGDAVYVTFDGSTPIAGAAHRLASGTSLTWSTATFNQAKFSVVSTTATLYASPFQV